LDHTSSVDLLPFPRDVYRSSMIGNDHGSWRGKWPANLTTAGEMAAKNSDETMRREMFSPYGRGRGSDGGVRGKRSGSAPPRLSQSLNDFVKSKSEDPYSTPYATPVADQNKREDSFVIAERTIPKNKSIDIIPPKSLDNSAIPVIPSSVVSNVSKSNRDISAAVSKWAAKSLAELVNMKGNVADSNGGTNVQNVNA
jgi:hypothetical protein